MIKVWPSCPNLPYVVSGLEALLEVSEKVADLLTKIEAQSLAEAVGSYWFVMSTTMQLDAAVDLLATTKTSQTNYRAKDLASAHAAAKDM